MCLCVSECMCTPTIVWNIVSAKFQIKRLENKLFGLSSHLYKGHIYMEVNVFNLLIVFSSATIEQVLIYEN